MICLVRAAFHWRVPPRPRGIFFGQPGREKATARSSRIIDKKRLSDEQRLQEMVAEVIDKSMKVDPDGGREFWC